MPTIRRITTRGNTGSAPAIARNRRALSSPAGSHSPERRKSGDPQQRQQEPDDSGKDSRASFQFLDPVQQLPSVLVELFEGDHRPRAAAPPRGGGRSRDVEAMVLREGAVTAHLIAETVVVRAASLEEDRGHVSRISGRRDRARADEARLALRKSCRFNDVASANAKLQDVLLLSRAGTLRPRPISKGGVGPCSRRTGPSLRGVGDSSRWEAKWLRFRRDHRTLERRNLGHHFCWRHLR
jgi:hypothetical protein